MTLLHAHAQYIFIVNAKYQKPSVKALVTDDFPVYAPAKSLFKSKQEKNGSFQRNVILSKTLFLASNFFMQMFNESILCRQSIELFRHKLWYKLNSPHMYYLYTYHTKLLRYAAILLKSIFFFAWHFSCTCSIYLYCICKVSESFSKSSGTSWLPRVCTI